MSAASASANANNSVTHAVTQVNVNPSPKAVHPSRCTDSSAGHACAATVNNPVNFDKMKKVLNNSKEESSDDDELCFSGILPRAATQGSFAGIGDLWETHTFFQLNFG